MLIFFVVIFIVAIYSLFMFVALRLIIPFMGFNGFKKSEVLPEEIKNQIVILENQATDAQSYLLAVYNLILQKTLHQYKHTRFRAAINFPRAFVKDLKELWITEDFVYCTGINYLLFLMLINSKFFKSHDIKIRYVFLNFVPHQYLQVNINGVFVDVDPAGAGIRGKKLGTHAAIFG